MGSERTLTLLAEASCRLMESPSRDHVPKILRDLGRLVDITSCPGGMREDILRGPDRDLRLSNVICPAPAPTQEDILHSTHQEAWATGNFSMLPKTTHLRNGFRLKLD